MKCPNCHEPVDVNAKFCPNCGFALKEPETRTKRHHEEPMTQRTNSEGNVFIAYAKNNFLLLLILLVIAAGLFMWKVVLGVIALVLILMMYYLRATATDGDKEKISRKLQSRSTVRSKRQRVPLNTNSSDNYQQTAYQEPERPERHFNSLLNLLILIISAAVTIASDFVGNFIQIDAQTSTLESVNTQMSLYGALNLGGIADKITSALNIQIGIQGILVAIFYVLVALPVLVILLAFAGGRFSRFVLSLITCATYVGALGTLYYETIQLNKLGITLGLTPGIMFYVAIVSSFVMLVYSTKIRK